MFCRRNYLLALNSLGKGNAKPCNVFGRFAKTSDVNYWVGGVIINVEHRGIDMANPDCLRLAAGNYAHPASEFGVSRRRNGHRPRKVCRVFEPHSDTCLGIERHEQRTLCILLHPIGENRRFVDRSSKKDDTADFVFDNVPSEIFEKRTVLIGKPRVYADMDKLADLFLDRHFLNLFCRKVLRLFAGPKAGNAGALACMVAASAARQCFVIFDVICTDARHAGGTGVAL